MMSMETNDEKPTLSAMDNVVVRKTAVGDLPRLREVFAAARRFMRSTGNLTQWDDSYPGDDLLMSDIAGGDSYVCLLDGRIVGTFLLRGGDDPTYASISGGRWLNDQPYATLHRVASSGEARGLLHLAVAFALKRYSNLRIDTHSDNTPMRRAVASEGFRYCGIIRCWNGTERLAYQYAAER